jgi:hypothetical protein
VALIKLASKVWEIYFTFLQIDRTFIACLALDSPPLVYNDRLEENSADVGAGNNETGFFFRTAGVID